MNYEELKREITEIVAICKDVPEEFRLRCFELLVSRLVQPAQFTKSAEVTTPTALAGLSGPEEASQHESLDVPMQIPGAVKAFLRKSGLKDDGINKLVMFDGSELHFIKEPSHTNARRGQNEWALLLALKNALVSGGGFKVDPEEVRSTAQQKGFYDKTNFATNFKADKYAGYYRGIMEPQGAAQLLSKEGEDALADLIKSLTA